MNKAAEIRKLKKIAAVRYDLDGGEMYECTEREEYIALIEEHGSAEKAWEWHMVGACIRMDERIERRAAYADCIEY